MSFSLPALNGTLARYFGLRFLSAVLLVFVSIFALVALLDYIELMRRASDVAHVSPLLVFETSIFRVPQIIERVMPFCILIGAMSSYLSLSRRLELVVARAAGMSAWQFITPAVVIAFLLGVFATTAYNPVSAVLQERSKKLQAELFGRDLNGFGTGGGGGGSFWANQKTNEGQAIINAKSSRDQGVALSGVTVFTFSPSGGFQQRIEARAAVLDPGVWKLLDARVYRLGQRPRNVNIFRLKTSLTPEQVRESFATPETVPFWDLPQYIKLRNTQDLSRQGIDCSSRSFLPGPSCWRPWFCWRRPSVYGSSALAVFRRWF